MSSPDGRPVSFNGVNIPWHKPDPAYVAHLKRKGAHPAIIARLLRQGK